MKDPKDNDKSQDRGERDEEGRRGPRLGDFAKKLFNTGAEAMHMTEEGLRNVLGDVSAREAVSGLFESVSKGTDTLQLLFVREARRYLDAINFRDELGRVLSNYTIEVNAKINFVPRDKSTEKRRGKASADKDARVETQSMKVKFIQKDETEVSSEGAAEGEGPEKSKKG